jgi:hypothetical protein
MTRSRELPPDRDDSLRLPRGSRVLLSEGTLLVVVLPAVPSASEVGPVGNVRAGRVEADRRNAELVAEFLRGKDRGMRAGPLGVAVGLTTRPCARALALAVAEGWIRARSGGVYVHADIPLSPWEAS